MDRNQTSISYIDQPGYCTLRLVGMLGVADAEELHQTAGELCAYRKDIVVDWDGATQLDASIAQVLLSLRAALGAEGRSLSATPPPPAIRAWMQAAGLSQLLIPQLQESRTSCPAQP